MSSKFELTDAVGKKKGFNTIEELAGFLVDEAGAWKRLREDSNMDSDSLHRYFCHDLLYKFASSIKGNNADVYTEVDIKVGEIVQKLRYNWVWSGHPHMEEFARCNRLYGKDVADGFLDGIITELEAGSVPAARIRMSYFEGQMMATFFLKNQALKEGFQGFLEKSKTETGKLEQIYEEKLRLEKPAEYWKKASQKFESQGRKWVRYLIGFLVAGIISFAVFFRYWLMGQEIPVELDTVQGIVIFSTMLALFAFLVRILSRLAFSAFHLMRDAEEREQLTYLYLSLTKEKTIDQKSRNLILQALFSRSETGLLSGESGPSMPGAHEIKDLSNP